MPDQQRSTRAARPRHSLMCRPPHFTVDYSITPWTAPALAGKLADRGCRPVGVGLSEELKGGGSVKCSTLEISHRTTGGRR
ncbi:hypothetical protein ABZ951_11595 [Streptomyces sp. NPDC046215]|uniref:Uncharacterized protein n=1 Tax=Streptomyces stramineus TaxID=173861 RepID=A0ABN1AB65_9ACTN